MPDVSSITAVLGPTNTGKTHRAVECMLTHESGMIGLPLRLLAREVYDRVTARVGEARVALVTGEEKRVPRRPDYWVCTVEAMPLDREVDFLAVDEVQLAAHPQRGHVFTDRLLHARGRRETWFLGADTMRPLLREMLPTAQFPEHPRLSRLAFAGAEKLSRLPARSAVIAFSTPHVYELAERLRQLYGGVAVVLGALSPRTRNAQVALFQSGEVDVIVATDAIGMGLNLDVDHVAFGALRKFDGREQRELDPAELAQIAGRAGRHHADGTFGSLAPVELPMGVVGAIESHRFPPVRRLVWRNADLDFASVDALLASLAARPRAHHLRLVEAPEDAAALAALARVPLVRERARGPEAVRLLWDVCTVPDFRKLLLEAHVGLLGELYAQLTGPAARLDPDWIAARIRDIDDTAGDLDTLMARIAAIRTWTYISHRPEWVPGAAEWQERTREIEDRLSDALHERLVQRFVEQGRPRRRTGSARARPRRAGRVANTAAALGEELAAAAQRPAALAPVQRAIAADARAGQSVPAAAPAHPFARLAALRAPQAPSATSAARAVGEWVESLVAADHARFALDPAGQVAFDGRVVGQLVCGSRLVLPDVKLVGLADLGAGAQARVLRRLVAFARDAAGELLGPVRAAAARVSPEARPLLYALEQRLGTVLLHAGDELARAHAALTPADRALLAASGIAVGERVVHVPALAAPEVRGVCVALVTAFYGRARTPAPPPAPALASVPRARAVDPGAYEALGFPVLASRAVRADVVERVARALAQRDRPDVRRLGRWIGCAPRELSPLLDALTGSPRDEAPG